jgi:hypothetical protein
MPRVRLVSWLIAAALGVLGAGPGLAAGADERPTRHEIWDIKLGAKIDAVPGLPLSGWKDFRRCRPEPSGLREVYFRYDDELEYWAKANNLEGQMEQYVGTKTYGFPITVSALIDDGGEVRGIRIVTDPRDPSGDRDEAYLLRNFLNARLGRDGWTCEDLAADGGETPVAGVFIKQRCKKQIDDATGAVLVTRHLRKPGQSQYDPHSGKETTNQFESNVRFEMVRTK